MPSYSVRRLMIRLIVEKTSNCSFRFTLSSVASCDLSLFRLLLLLLTFDDRSLSGMNFCRLLHRSTCQYPVAAHLGHLKAQRRVNVLAYLGLLHYSQKNRRRRIQRSWFAILLCVLRMPAARPHK